MRWLAIFNPRSGYHAAQEMHALSAAVQRRVGADIAWTRCRKHAAELVRQNWNYDGFIAVGGDGTISEIVNELNAAKHALGIIPAGTGNGLARDLGLQDWAAALHALSRARFDRLDTISVRYQVHGVWQEHMLISTSGIGYLAGATELAELPFKRWGNWYYAISAILQSFRQRDFAVHLRFDDGEWQKLTLSTLVVHNNQYVGQFRMFPEASLTDGRLNVLYGRLRPRQQLLEDLGILTQTYLFARTQRRAVRKLELILPVPGTLMIDGDLFPEVERVDFEVVPGRLRCCTGDPSRLAPSDVLQRSSSPAPSPLGAPRGVPAGTFTQLPPSGSHESPRKSQSRRR